MSDRAWDRRISQAVDDISTTTFKIPSVMLMERAGLAACEVIAGLATDFEQILILAGTGNNGGDGLVIARELAARGLKIHTLVVAKIPAKYSPLCRLQKEILESLQQPVAMYSFGCFKRFQNQKVLIVDALLGIGFTPPLEDGPLRDELAEAATIPNKFVVSIDVPSGLAVDSWNYESLLPSNRTLTFGGLKPCQLMEPSRKWNGDISVINPGFPSKAFVLAEQQTPAKLRQLNEVLRCPLKTLPADAHKYDRGHVLIFGGSPGKYGAPIMAGVAASRAGAGWITIASESSELSQLIEPHQPELTFEPLPLDHTLAIGKFIEARRVQTVLFGPGWINQQLTPNLLKALADWQNTFGIKVVFDAGATRNLETLLASTPLNPRSTVATLHPGEWSKLFSVPLPWQSLDDTDEIMKRTTYMGATVIYKGATPTIFAPGLWSNVPTVAAMGSNIVAKAGAGDVLSGIISAYAVHSEHVGIAAAAAIQNFYRSSELAALQQGPGAVLPTDLVSWIGIAAAN